MLVTVKRAQQIKSTQKGAAMKFKACIACGVLVACGGKIDEGGIAAGCGSFSR
jgi:hypothetical protein